MVDPAPPGRSCPVGDGLRRAGSGAAWLCSEHTCANSLPNRNSATFQHIFPQPIRHPAAYPYRHGHSHHHPYTHRNAAYRYAPALQHADPLRPFMVNR